jgi:hypothetical protein
MGAGGDRESPFDGPGVRDIQANDGKKLQTFGRFCQMVVDGHHASDTTQLGQAFQAGFVIFQAGNQIDMHQQMDVIERWLLELPDHSGKFRDRTTLQDYRIGVGNGCQFVGNLPKDGNDGLP